MEATPLGSRGMLPDRRGRRRPEWSKFLSKAQLKLLLETTRTRLTSRDYYLLCCMYFFGLRASEAVSLRPEHFDLHRQILAIPSAKKRRTKHAYPADGMTGRPLIEVPFLGGQGQLKVIQSMLAWAQGRTWLFPGARNTHLTTRAVRGVMKAALAEAGLDPAYHPHTLRHTAGSLLYESTKDMLLVRDFLRHSSVVVTDTYLHSLGGEKAKGALSL